MYSSSFRKDIGIYHFFFCLFYRLASLIFQNLTFLLFGRLKTVKS